MAVALQEPPRIAMCLKCQETKELYTPMLYYCKECSWEFAKKTEKTYRARKWAWLKSLKEDQPCTDCGRKEPYYNMHWDHLRDKEFNLGSAVRLGRQRILDELAKCELVCALCHGHRTHRRRVEQGKDIGSQIGELV